MPFYLLARLVLEIVFLFPAGLDASSASGSGEIGGKVELEIEIMHKVSPTLHPPPRDPCV